MKLTLSPEVFGKALDRDKVRNMTEVKEKSGLNYQTVMKLCKGTFGVQLLDILGKYLSALGYKAEDVAEMRMRDVFDIEEYA
jgi:hypothetical protein